MSQQQENYGSQITDILDLPHLNCPPNQTLVPFDERPSGFPALLGPKQLYPV